MKGRGSHPYIFLGLFFFRDKVEKKIEKIDRELNDLPKINHNTLLWSEVAINQLLELDLFQGDIIMALDKPSSRNIKKDLTKRWPK